MSSDAVLFTVGWPANLEDLHLEAAVIEADGKCIPSTRNCERTSRTFFAVGDVNGIQMLVQTAARQGILAAENAVLGHDRPYESKIVPSGSFTDLECASVGLTEPEARERDDCVVACYDYDLLTQAVVDGRVEGFLQLDRRTSRIIGAHVLREYSAEQMLGNRVERIAPLLQSQGFVVNRRHSTLRRIAIVPPYQSLTLVSDTTTRA